MKRVFGPIPRTHLSLRRMLVVDDQVFNIEFLRCQIELIPSMTGRADYVDNGQAAVDLVLANLRSKEEHPDLPFWGYSLILLDYSMPNMDGPATAINICNAYRHYDATPPHIVCLTAFTEKIYKDKACDSGMNEFISKPIDNNKLRKIMRE